MLSTLVGKISIDEHPARKELFGMQVPAFPNQKQILINGRRVAYCGSVAGMPINFITCLPKDYIDSVVEYVTQQIGAPNKIAEPPAVDEHGVWEDRNANVPPEQSAAQNTAEA